MTFHNDNVRREFRDAVDEAFEAGWQAAMDARAQQESNAFTVGFVSQWLKQQFPAYTLIGDSTGQQAEAAARELLRVCQISVYPLAVDALLDRALTDLADQEER